MMLHRVWPVAAIVMITALMPGVARASQGAAPDSPYEQGLAFTSVVEPGETIRITNAAGEELNGASDRPRVSGNGRFIAFDSRATNAVPGIVDRNHNRDVFVYDRRSGLVELISKGIDGETADGLSTLAGISRSGRYVVFASKAGNLVEGDSPGGDVFRYDRHRGAMDKVSVSLTGGNGDGFSTRPEISADGRWVIFNSAAENLVENDANGKKDIFVRDMADGVTYLVSQSTAGVQSDEDSFRPEISADGTILAFASDASTLSSLDINGKRDIYVHYRLTGVTELVSVNQFGGGALGNSSRPSISRDGRWISFRSVSRDLVPDDDNASVDTFVRDVVEGVTYPVSVDLDGQLSAGDSDRPVVSDDGRFVAFNSSNNNLVAPDAVRTDVFVRDRYHEVTHRISISLNEKSPNGRNYRPEISDNARVIVYRSKADDIVEGDSNLVEDLFIVTMSYDPATDVSAPLFPTDLVAIAPGTAVGLSWTPAVDDRAVTSYEVWRDGELVGSTTGLSYVDDNAGRGLAPDSRYAYEVVAVDGVGNRSEPASALVTTGPDTHAPSPLPGAPVSVESGPRTISISWTPAGDNVGVARYKLVRDGVAIRTFGPGVTTYVDTDAGAGLTLETGYEYRVVAYDDAGNKVRSPIGYLHTTDIVDPDRPSLPG